MKNLINKVLLAGNKFMPEMHLRQPRCTPVLVNYLLKIKKKIQKFKERRDSRYIYQNELEKACFQNNIAYGGFKDLARRTTSDKVLQDKAFNIAKIQSMMVIKEVMVYNFFTKSSLMELLHMCS